MDFQRLTVEEEELVIDRMIEHGEEYFDRTGINLESFDLEIGNWVDFIDLYVQELTVTFQFAGDHANFNNLIRL